METKIIEPKTFFYSEGKTTLNKIHAYADREVPRILKEMGKIDLKENGPMEFIYLGATNDMEKEFTLRIAVPVMDTRSADEGFKFADTEVFKCVSTEYKGDVNKMFPVYEKIYEHINRSQHQPNDEIREVYHHWEHPTSETNITEIQVGIN